MRNNTEMPTIGFGEGTDYDSLFNLLWCVNKGGSGDTLFDFHIDGGGVATGTFHASDEDDMVIQLYNENWFPSGEYATVETDLIERLVYL